MIHGDLHYENVLAADREPWLVIDPKPMAGDPHYEVAPLLWNRWDEVVASGDVRDAVRRRFHTVVDTAGLDEDRARDWVVVREMHNAMWASRTPRRGRTLDAEDRDVDHHRASPSPRRSRTERSRGRPVDQCRRGRCGRHEPHEPPRIVSRQRRHARGRRLGGRASAGPRSTSTRSTGPVARARRSASRATRSPTPSTTAASTRRSTRSRSEDLDAWSERLGRAGPDRACSARTSPPSGIDVNEAVIGEHWRIGTTRFEVVEVRIPCNVSRAGWACSGFDNADVGQAVHRRRPARVRTSGSLEEGTSAGRRRDRRRAPARPRRHRLDDVPGVHHRAGRCCRGCSTSTAAGRGVRRGARRTSRRRLAGPDRSRRPAEARPTYGTPGDLPVTATRPAHPEPRHPGSSDVRHAAVSYDMTVDRQPRAHVGRHVLRPGRGDAGPRGVPLPGRRRAGSRSPGRRPATTSPGSRPGWSRSASSPSSGSAIASGTRYEWILADLAIMSRGRRDHDGLPVARSPRTSPTSSATPSRRVVFAEDDAQIAKLREQRGRAARTSTRSSPSTAPPTATG